MTILENERLMERLGHKVDKWTLNCTRCPVTYSDARAFGYVCTAQTEAEVDYIRGRGPAPLGKPLGQRPPLVYVAGPFSKGDVMLNIRAAMNTTRTLIDRGFVVFCPHLSGFQHLVDPRSYDEWLAYDLKVILCCDAVYRMPGESPGADKEVVFAVSHGIPVYSSLETLYAGTDAQLRKATVS